MTLTIILLLGFGAFLVLPAVMIWGWVRLARRKEKVTLFLVLSIAGLVLATVSELLGISTGIYACVSGGFATFDPTLMKIYAWGTLLSFVGVIFATAGLWRPSSIRWHALVCSIGTLMYWLAEAAAE
jgi:hypothetical protein